MDGTGGRERALCASTHGHPWRRKMESLRKALRWEVVPVMADFDPKFNDEVPLWFEQLYAPFRWAGRSRGCTTGAGGAAIPSVGAEGWLGGAVVLRKCVHCGAQWCSGVRGLSSRSVALAARHVKQLCHASGPSVRTCSRACTQYGYMATALAGTGTFSACRLGGPRWLTSGGRSSWAPLACRKRAHRCKFKLCHMIPPTSQGGSAAQVAAWWQWECSAVTEELQAAVGSVVGGKHACAQEPARERVDGLVALELWYRFPSA